MRIPIKYSVEYEQWGVRPPHMLADRFSNNFLQLLNTNNVGKEGVRYNKGQEKNNYVTSGQL